MEIRERLLQSADWCNSHDALHERLKHIAADLRDATAEIDTLESGRVEYSRQIKSLEGANRTLQAEIERLKEQVQIKATAASDVELFRKEDQKRADAVILGMTMAIRVMAEGLSAKGGK
jgi:peptidoglycan hydrolase CwlO-like protein